MPHGHKAATGQTSGSLTVLEIVVGTAHCFQNVGDTPGRLLVITTPSGLERFFEQFAELLPGPVAPEAMTAVSHASWLEFIGPPASVSDPL